MLSSINENNKGGQGTVKKVGSSILYLGLTSAKEVKIKK